MVIQNNTDKHFWTEEEIKLLKEKRPFMTCKQDVIDLFPHLNYKCIHGKARKLGMDLDFRNVFQITKEELYDLYWKQKLSCGQIAEKINATTSIIQGCLKKYEIPRRTMRESKREMQKYNGQDLIGKTYGCNTVLELDDEIRKSDGAYFWKCKCNLCEKTKYYTTYQLMHNGAEKCRCMSYKGYKDLSGTYFSIIIHGAEERNLEFKVTIEFLVDLFEKQNGKCALTNLDIKLMKNYQKDKELQTASLDRIDSKIGYLENNVQWVHRDINFMKQEYDERYYIDMCHRVSETDKLKQKPHTEINPCEVKQIKSVNKLERHT